MSIVMIISSILTRVPLEPNTMVVVLCPYIGMIHISASYYCALRLFGLYESGSVKVEYGAAKRAVFRGGTSLESEHNMNIKIVSYTCIRRLTRA